jgi:hypothetical protein
MMRGLTTMGSRRSAAAESAPDGATPRGGGRGRVARAVAGVEERFLVPCHASPRRRAWIAAYGVAALALQARGRERYGVVRIEGEPVRVTAIGRSRRINALIAHWFDRPLPGLDAGPTRCLWRPHDCMRRPAELHVAEIHAWAAPRFRRAGWHIVPDSVRWVADLDRVPPRAPGRSLRSDLGKVRGGEFAMEQTDARADWDEFYSTMVRPAALRRFGEDAWIPSARTMRAFGRVGTLLMLTAAGERVAGICVIRTGTSLWAPVLGVADAPDSESRTGVGAALYKLTFDWARARGIRTVDFGRTSSRIDDPIAWYKRKWGFRPVLDPLAHRLAVRIDPDSPVHRAVARSPVLVEEPEGLVEIPGEG